MKPTYKQLEHEVRSLKLEMLATEHLILAMKEDEIKIKRLQEDISILKTQTDPAEYLAKIFGDSAHIPTPDHFTITVMAIEEKDVDKARCLQRFLNVRYNQLYHKL